MIRKIKIKKLEKPTAYIDNEWAVVFSRRDKMLSDSHWINTSDSQLTLSCKVKFALWRAMLRFLVKEDWASPDVLSDQLDWLETKRPSLEYLTPGEFSYMIPYEINTRSITDLKISAIMLLEYHIDVYQKYLKVATKNTHGLSLPEITKAKFEIKEATTYEIVIASLCKFYQGKHIGH